MFFLQCNGEKLSEDIIAIPELLLLSSGISLSHCVKNETAVQYAGNLKAVMDHKLHQHTVYVEK